MILFKRLRQKTIAADKEKRKFHKNIDADIKRVKKINERLNNGITFKIFQATGGKHGH